MEKMSDIYYGRTPSTWAPDVEEWNVDKNQHLKDYVEAEKRLKHGENVN